MALSKKALRSILENKARYIGSALLLLISSMLFIALIQTSSSISNTFEAYSKENALSDAEFTLSDPIDAAAYEANYKAAIELGGTADCEVQAGQVLRVFAAMSTVNVPAMKAGTLPGTGQIAIDSAFAGANSYSIGDIITLAGKSYEISGFVLLPNYIYIIKSKEEMMNDPKAFGIAVMGKEDFAGLPNKQETYAIRFESREGLNAAMADVKTAIRSEGIKIVSWQATERKVNVSYIPMEADVLSIMSRVMPASVLALVCILLAMMARRTVASESVQIGAFYAEGYRKRELVRHYMLAPLILALVGAGLGALLGIAMAGPMFDFMLTAFPMPAYPAPLSPLLVCLAISLPACAMCLAAYLAVNGVLKETPASLMRGGAKEDKLNFLERGLKLDRLAFVRKFQLRSQIRGLGRAVFLLFGVVVASMLILYGFTMKSSIDYMLKEGVSEFYALKNEYVFKEARVGKPPEGTEPFNAAYVSLASDDEISFYVTGILEDTKMIRLYGENKEPLKADKVSITLPLAQKLNAAVGSKIEVFDTDSGLAHSIVVEQMVDTYAGEFIFMPLDDFNAEFGYPLGAYTGIWCMQPMQFEPSEIASTKSIDSIVAGFGVFLNQMGPMIYSFIGGAFAIGLIIIYIATGMVIEESRQSVSLMKVFGYSKREVAKLVLEGNAYIAALGYIIAIPCLGASLGVLYNSLADVLQMAIPVKLNWLYVAIGFVVILATYETAKAMSKKKLDQIPMSEALKAGTE